MRTYRGYERSLARAALRPRGGRIENLTETFDRSADELAMVPDARHLFHGGKRNAEAVYHGARFGAERRNHREHFQHAISFSADANAGLCADEPEMPAEYSRCERRRTCGN